MTDAGLPSGTVTFLFTDIEGSTRLLSALGQHRYDELLTEHDTLMRAAFAAHEGRVVDTQGDSFFVAFRTAADAVAAAVDAQRDLTAWRGDVKVRMGLHTGEPKVGEERYVGIGVHRAARIGAAGHGGQVLLSSTTKELAEEDLAPGVTIRDLGERRLKDIEQPQHVYQLVIDGLPSEFGALHTLDVELARRRRRMYLGAALVGVVAAAVAIPVFALGQGGSGGTSVEGNGVAEIDPGSSDVIGTVANVGSSPGPIAYGAGSLWVANADDQTVARIAPDSRTVTRNLSVRGTPMALAASPGAIWVVGASAGLPAVSVERIDPRYETVTQGSVGNVTPGGPGVVAALGNAVWVAPSTGLLARLRPATGRVADRVDPNAAPAGVAVSRDAVWVTDSFADTVTRVDPATGLTTPITVGRGPAAIAGGEGAVWVANSLGNSVTRIDPGTNGVTNTISVGAGPAGLAVAQGAVWVANSHDGTVTRIDSRTLATRTIVVGGSPRGVAVGGGHVWVTVQAVAPGLEGGPEGGSARLTAESDVDSTDPALSWSALGWELEYATCAKLLNYADLPAPRGTQLVPEVAQALPRISDGGRTYTFTIRKGFRFSPPSNAPVTAHDFKYTIERTLSPKTRSPMHEIGNDYMRVVAGADAFMSGRAPHISGIVAGKDTLTIRLVKPAPDFLTFISLPFFCAVPVGTPLAAKGVRVIPSAGPYSVVSSVPGQGVVLQRNRNYHGGRPHRLDRITLVVGIPQDKAVREIEAGRADYAADGVPATLDRRLEGRYGRAKKAARQYFVNALPVLDYFMLNTHRPLFRDVRLRRAVNYALDRRALSRVGNLVSGFPDQTTDSYLPSAIPGSTEVHAYPSTPDVAAARRLAGTKRRRAVMYTCTNQTCAQQAQIVKENLAAIGIDVQVKSFPAPQPLFARVAKKGEPFDIALGAWYADYIDPDQFLNALLSSGTDPTFEDPAAQRKLAAAARLSGPARYLAYSKLNDDLVRNGAPLAAWGNASSQDFFSARMGCQVFNPLYKIDLAALCIRR
ncbi:MAG TPA: ABC transporter substrate-binding protein [Gaiellaceae bacterium]|nr:ABC transporter substrate-binding protein [Gaiellaceae bacterium]